MRIGEYMYFGLVMETPLVYLTRKWRNICLFGTCYEYLVVKASVTVVTWKNSHRHNKWPESLSVARPKSPENEGKRLRAFQENPGFVLLLFL
jgi:hypothetical protein